VIFPAWMVEVVKSVLYIEIIWGQRGVYRELKSRNKVLDALKISFWNLSDIWFSCKISVSSSHSSCAFDSFSKLMIEGSLSAFILERKSVTVFSCPWMYYVIFVVNWLIRLNWQSCLVRFLQKCICQWLVIHSDFNIHVTFDPRSKKLYSINCC